MAQTRPRPGNSFGPSKTPTIIAHSALYRWEGEARGGIYPLAADECCGRRIPRGSRGEEFFGDHPPALSLSCSTALGNLGQAHCDHTLGVKPDVQHIDPKLPVGVHRTVRSGLESYPIILLRPQSSSPRPVARRSACHKLQVTRSSG